ncbi:Vacuolar protein-sorting-associated protein 33 [Thecaphora frezii]
MAMPTPIQSAAAQQQQATTASPNPNNAAFGDPASSTPWDGLDTSLLSELAKRGLLTTLDTIKEAKTLMLDPSLAGPLGLVADVASLKQHGVERMFWLEPASPAFAPRKPASSSATPQQQAPPQSQSQPLKAITAPTRSVVYICRPELRWMSAIAEHIRADRAVRPSSPLQHTYTVTFVPHRTEPCLQFLDRESVLSDVSLLDFGLEFVPLDKDVISLEEDSAWKRIFADGDHTCIFRSAQALMTMQHAYGLFPRIIGKGNLARRLADLLLRQRREHLASDPTNPSLTTPSTSIDSLIILDRSVDFATPLCTQLTYEGLIDEVVGIRNAHVEVDPALLSSTNQPAQTNLSQPSGSGTPLQMTSTPKKRKHRLDSTSDSLFAEIRDLNFAVVGEKLHRAAKRLNEDYEGRHHAKTVSQIRAFVGKLGGLQNEHASLRLHTGLTEKIMHFTGREEFNRMLEIQQNLVAGLDMNAQQAGIEDMVNEERSLVAVLRLLCLSSIVGSGGGGIKAKNLEFIKREILQTYGYQHLALLLTLQKVGLLSRAASGGGGNAVTSAGGVVTGLLGGGGVGGGGSKADKELAMGGNAEVGGTGRFSSVRKALRLINDDVDERNPADVAYVYSGYAPLSIRLVQAVAQKEAILDAQATPRVTELRPKAHPIVGWRGFEDVVYGLAGATFDEVQGNALAATTAASAGGGGGSSSGGQGGQPTTGAGVGGGGSGGRLATSNPYQHHADGVTTTLVFFLGGVTFTEIAALRFMSRQTRNRRFVVVTTNTLSGDSMIRDLSHGSL